MNNIEILKNHLLKTGVRISKIDTSSGWVYICFETVDVSLLQRIGALIESLFKKENRYTHLLPKFMGKDGMMCLCITEDVINQINK